MRNSKQLRHNTFPDVTLLSDVFDQGVPAEEVQAQQKSMPARLSRGVASHAVWPIGPFIIPEARRPKVLPPADGRRTAYRTAAVDF